MFTKEELEILKDILEFSIDVQVELVAEQKDYKDARVYLELLKSIKSKL